MGIWVGLLGLIKRGFYSRLKWSGRQAALLIFVDKTPGSRLNLMNPRTCASHIFIYTAAYLLDSASVQRCSKFEELRTMN